jgi:hypothetical protein
MLKATHRVQRCMALGDKNSKAAFGGRDIRDLQTAVPMDRALCNFQQKNSDAKIENTP